MRKFIFGTTFLLLAPFGLILLLIAVLLVYQTRVFTSSHLTALTETVAYAALPPEQNIVSASVTQSDGRVEHIRQFLAQYNSPLEQYASDIVQAADENGIDYRLTSSIAMQESGLCRTTPPGSNNCWGFGVYGGSALHFTDYKEGIYAVSKALGTSYKDHGLITPQQIMTMYTPSSDGSWAYGVNYFMDALR